MSQQKTAQATIPGLDFCKCHTCKKWIPTDHRLNFLKSEITRLETKLATTKNKKSLLAKIAELTSWLEEETKDREACKHV